MLKIFCFPRRVGVIHVLGMKLDEDLIKRILEEFEKHAGPYMPVALLAQNLGDREVLEAEACSIEFQEYILGEDRYCISEKLVFHLIHLTDLGCIKNVYDRESWGYRPVGMAEGDFPAHIDKSLDSGHFITPHCYSGDSGDSIIRLTSKGIQMRAALREELSDTVRTRVVEFGVTVVNSVIQSLVSSSVS